MTLVGNIKTVLVLLLGFVLLGGAPLTLLMAIGKCEKCRVSGIRYRKCALGFLPLVCPTYVGVEPDEGHLCPHITTFPDLAAAGIAVNLAGGGCYIF